MYVSLSMLGQSLCAKAANKLLFVPGVIILLVSFTSNTNVCSKGEKSALLEIKRGVPEGSVIAPTLFLLFINDLLESNMFCKSYAYAVCRCNEDLSYINEWCNKNRMVINHNKSQFLIVNSTKSIKLYVDGMECHL